MVTVEDIIGLCGSLERDFGCDPEDAVALLPPDEHIELIEDTRVLARQDSLREPVTIGGVRIKLAETLDEPVLVTENHRVVIV